MVSFFSSEIFSSKTFLISGAFIFGSGAVFLACQQYYLSQRQRQLCCEILQLNHRIMRLEKELKRLKETLTAGSSSTEEVDEIFVDASDFFKTSTSGEQVAIYSKERPDDLENVDKILKKVDQQMAQGEYGNLKDAFELLEAVSQKNPENVNVFWRLAKAAFLLASEEFVVSPNSGLDKQKVLMMKAQEAAAKALDIDKESGDAHKWMAIVFGSITQYLPMQEQIKSAYTIKEHIELAIKYKPTDFLPYHMLGRWCYSVYMLSWVERKIASTLFAEPPTATLDEALEYFLKAEELCPKSSIDNALYLAKCFIAKKDYKTAVSWLKVGMDLPCSSRDDQKSQLEIRELLSQYQAYDSS